MSQSAMMDYMTTDNSTEIGLLKAQLEHMGGALERIALCAGAVEESKRLFAELLKARVSNEISATQVRDLKALLAQCRKHVPDELAADIDDAA
jgi:hypothetical protein